MRGLNAEEIECLNFNLPYHNMDIEVPDDQCDIADRLVERGLMRKWFEVIDGEEWEYWETNSTGIMLLRIYSSMSFSVGI